MSDVHDVTCTCDTREVLIAVLEGQTPPPCDVHDRYREVRAPDDAVPLTASAAEFAARLGVAVTRHRGVD